MTKHSDWRNRVASSQDALNPGNKTKRPAVEIGRGQVIKSSVGSDPQAKAWGPKASLLHDDFKRRDLIEAGAGHVNMTAVGLDGGDVDDKAFDHATDDDSGLPDA